MLGNSWFKKERPLLGLFGSGGGIAQAAAGGAATGATVLYHNPEGTAEPTNPLSTDHELAINDKLQLIYDGMYYITITGATQSFRLHCQGAGGGKTPGPGNATGGAGGMVRGELTMPVSTVYTVIVGGGGRGSGSGYPGVDNPTGTPKGCGGWPNGGGVPSYNGWAGGGYSYIAETEIPYANRNDPTNVPNMRLIGGAGGGGMGYATSGGIMEGMGAYPAGYQGGGYYPADSTTGGGGTQNAGGTAGPGGRQGPGYAGSLFQGGPSSLPTPPEPNGGGSSGGGGYYGGGGAGGYYGMGGGGSGYIHPTLTSTGSFNASPGETQHYETANDPAYPISPTYPAEFGRGDQQATPTEAAPTTWRYPSPMDNGRGYVQFERLS